MRAAVVCNPSSAKEPEAHRREVVAALEAQGYAAPAWFETTPEEPGAQQARSALEQGAELVLVCGGDGTVMACAGALAGSGVPLAVIPAGTGNLLARNLGIPRDVQGAVEVAAHGRQRAIDVGTLDGRPFVVMAGTGFDAAMLADAPAALKGALGWPAYVVSASRHLLERRRTFTLALDDRAPVRRRGRGVLIGNVGRLQGGLPVLPDAEPDDGALDVAVIRARGLASWALLAASVVLRRPDPRRLETFRAERVVVTSSEPLATEADGEVLGEAARIEVALRPGALVVMVPAP
ncbi:YegS/Rv2252/BmrU family lipid kinase [Motilibacter rhizosphaerae]|uniref:YegS/Rv2252/BmrU family lipid kinase n=1 Tax=Motilibacter rhizosphaerae TaxID=598652 RepID=A0A4V2F4P3_9ACTN|nr:diacylglycerol kinase family protein [Motilibacter rhizosphaerae]RZS90019.1 YegS/Rv2252/BmrU family lipid kinase [Motilibacter rhizosphaerae]